MRLTAAALFLLLASPCYAADDVSSPETYIVEIEGQAPRTVVKIVPSADGMVALTGPDGAVDHIAAARVRSIRDDSGHDLTSNVVIGRETLSSRHPRREPKPIRYKSFRFRPGPPAECGSYLITESAAMWADGGYSLIEYGFAKNVGKSESIGITGFAGFEQDFTQTGLRLRLVHWIDRRVSVNVSPGLILGGSGVNGSTRLKRPQFVGQVGVSLNGRIGVAAEVFRVQLHDDYGSVPDVDETHFHEGIRLGAEPGLAGTLGALLMALILQVRD